MMPLHHHFLHKKCFAWLIVLLNLYYPIMFQINRSEDTRFAWRMFAWQKSQKCKTNLYVNNEYDGSKFEEELKIPDHWKIYFKLARHATDEKLFEHIVRNMCENEYKDLCEIKAYFVCRNMDMEKKVLFNNITIQCRCQKKIKINPK